MKKENLAIFKPDDIAFIMKKSKMITYLFSFSVLRDLITNSTPDTYVKQLKVDIKIKIN